MRRLAGGFALLMLSASCIEAQGDPLAAVAAAEQAVERGDRATATRLAQQVVSAYSRAGVRWTSTQLTALGRAHVVLGDAQSVRDALRAFDAAVAADPRNVDATIRTGDLFLDKYNAPEARESYSLVLARDSSNARALLGMARVLEFEGQSEALRVARRSVEADPQLVDAHLFLARLYLEAEQFDSATVAAERALRMDSVRVLPWAILGAGAWLTGDSATYRRTRAAAGRIDPTLARFDIELAEAAGRNRRYADAVRLAQRATEADAQYARAWGVLGSNQLRTGAMQDGRAALERAFAIDPFHLWHKNTLDLLDQVDGFATHRSARIELVAPANEAELLALYLLPLLESAYDTLAARYDYRPPTPIRIELYRRHADFSVRTVGLTGLGALGVSFGTVLAMDAPSARQRGEFNWGSTAWHELAHTFTLGASGHRVPRWFSEGLSVVEERRARPEWGAKPTVGFLEAYKSGRLRPLSELNEGFIRPRAPYEVQHSYVLASYVCEMIEERFGAAALPALLKAFGDGLDTPSAFRRVLRASPAQLDSQFDAWMAQRFAAPLAAIDSGPGGAPPTGPYPRTMRDAAAALERGDMAAATALLERARVMFPDYGGADGPGALLAQVAAIEGDLPRAARFIADVTTLNESAWEANAQEVSWRLSAADTAGAVRALRRMVWIYPSEVELHVRLATLAAAIGDHQTAVRERRAVVALRPTDLLEARYQLARALAGAGDRAAARRELLGVLEAAPGFEKAQALFLELRGGDA
jgi:tetratricopeptide (TPR) repeat protein